MTIRIIKNDATTLTYGEEKLLKKIKELYQYEQHESYIYVQPKIGTAVPDFVIIDAVRGISILEVKDWELSYIQDINKRKVKLADRDDVNPVVKTASYLNLFQGLVSTLDDKVEALDEYIFANTILSKITLKGAEEAGYTQYFKNYSVSCFTGDLVSKACIEDFFSRKVNDDLVNDKDTRRVLDPVMLSAQDLVTIRTLLFPEIKIQKPATIKEGSNITPMIFSLDEDQENFVRRMPYGNYIVSGLPGSGKTILCVSRAIHLIKEHPDWKIAILTFNKSLCTKIECELNRIAEEIKSNPFYKDLHIENITVTTFHKMVKNLVPKAFLATKDSTDIADRQKWWDYDLPKKALECAKPLYQAVIIDEYQDFLGATRCSMKSAA